MITLTSLRQRLAVPKTSWQLCLLAIIGGCIAAFVIILFTLSIEAIQGLYLSKLDDYSSLDGVSRFDLPIFGVLAILFIARLTGYQYLRAGIPFVLHRLKVAYGIIPFKNSINQFTGGIIALSTGFSVGKEGPAVHLGAACCSYIGNRLKLPFNSIKILCACGIAAAIAASFNTPVAAVIFVMEVILREYKVHTFIPIMIAAIVGSVITSSVFGPAHELEFFNTITLTLQHYPWLILLGLALGALGSLFNRYLVAIIDYFQHYHIFTRLMIAGLITGILGYVVPFAMGTDMSAISFALDHQWQWKLVLGLLAAKFLMTIFAIGLGIPGGIIGPILAIGAIVGTFTATTLMTWMPGQSLTSDFALMGMAGFMAATLNAPLTALLAVVELSNQVEIILPAMIVITVACLTSGQLFKNRSIFTMQLDIQKLIYRKPPIETSLQDIGVLGFLNTQFILVDNKQAQGYTVEILRKTKQVVILKRQGEVKTQYLQLELDNNKKLLDRAQPAMQTSPSVEQQLLLPLSSQATLAEAYVLLHKQRCGAVYIYGDNTEHLLGTVSFSQIKDYLLEGKIS
jgi:CIC family chloride channel protein